ncbi:MAG: baseplate multidomain protein megatron, partial [Planktomarina sp.]
AIQKLQFEGQEVLFYPFILMTQLDGNTLPSPWGGTVQPALPWRGRITVSDAPGANSTVDRTAAAEAQVDTFFGAAQASDFTVNGQTVGYSGPAEFSYRRFILHYAHLCKLAGGVEAFCIGSEMRSLTWVRGASDQFVAVQHLKQLAGDVRSILGPDTKISYAADWSEYFGFQPQDGTNDRYFHLDPLWSDPNIDFIGIDNYMPLSDWRDGCDHLDADAGSIYNLPYLQSNIEGGEGFDWYYHSEEARAAQFRDPIEDGSESEPWAFRYKDIRGWWQNPHYNRVNDVRSLDETDWVPQSKPIWFTELGCAAVDRATNQPNKFLDPKSSESTLPHYSNGQRDELIQMQYLRAMYGHWNDAANNPQSSEYDGAMLDMSRAHVWAWDARPYPQFPDLLDVWSDGANYAKGHWINGRSNARPLDSLVTEICAKSGVTDVDVSQLYGYVRGYSVPDITTARAALQPLMVAYGFDAVEREGTLVFRNRTGRKPVTVDASLLVRGPDTDPPLTLTREPKAEIADRVRLNYVRADGSFEAAAAETVFPEDDTMDVAVTDLNLALTREEAQQITERWLAESRISRDKARFALPPSQTALGAADVVAIAEPGGFGTYRLDHVEVAGERVVEAVRIEDASYDLLDLAETVDSAAQFTSSVAAASPVFSLFLDLPILSGDEVAHAPHLAVTADPWPGGAAVYQAATDSNYVRSGTVFAPATMGTTLTDLPRAAHGIVDHGPALDVDLTFGGLSSATADAILAGANAAAIGDGSPDNWEVFQFETATPINATTYRLSGRLRGQVGTDALMPDVWPAGSYFVLLNAAVDQIALPFGSRGVEQYFKIGPDGIDMTHPSFSTQSHAFQGNGLRPYAPVWLQTEMDGTDLNLTWTRRTRMHGDGWDQIDVPMYEVEELYFIEVVSAGTVIRNETSGTNAWTYTEVDRLTDGVNGQITLRVAQVSNIYGPGLYQSLDVMI